MSCPLASGSARKNSSVDRTDLATEIVSVQLSVQVAGIEHNCSMAGDAGATPEQWLGRAGVTEREAEVLSALAGRLRNREIAAQLHISVRTVESHIAALMRKLGVTDRMALAEIAGRLPRVSRAAATI